MSSPAAQHPPQPDSACKARRTTEVPTTQEADRSDQCDAANRVFQGSVVRSCVCCRVPFEEIYDAASGREAGLVEAYRKTGCGGRCGLCLPYIKLMLRTGRTSFPAIPARTFTELGISPGRIGLIERAIARHRADAK